MKAKSTFSGGLVMDFAPDNTSADTLTSALNATLTTFNGNEMALQNDMGNARVETAYLPEGYVPVGTCEYGDIIYIVSYNPLLNKSQIGCFPSPERNISSDEIINGGDKQQISESQFLKSIKDNFGIKEVTTTSAKFILTKKNLNPGDKYIIYTDNIFEEPHITDIGNTDHDYGKFPKYLKMHVISIDNSNKIDYLDSDVIWYDKVAESSRKDYFINEINKDSTDKPDIDSYRNALSSGYSVFQSKVSGKLALLVELETIDTFSCTYNIYKHINENQQKEELIEYQKYDIYFNINWKTSNFNVNPSQICLYRQNWSGISPDFAGKVLYWEKKLNEDFYYIQKDPKTLDLSQLESPNLIDSNHINIKAVQDSDSTWENVYKANISRSYLPENLINYEDFKTKASYDKILDITLKYIKYTQYINDNPVVNKDQYILNCEQKKPTKNQEAQNNWLDVDTSEISLSSVVANRVKGIPLEGEYYVNANSVFLDKELKYYTSYNDTEIRIYPYKITDDIINNYFRYSISKKFAEISIPVKQKFEKVELTPDISNLIYNYEVAPVMPYGILSHLISKGTINFSKIGSGEITMPQWKYYNTENTSTLTIGFNIFPEENMGVAGIDIDFLDNQGIAATYSLDNNSSYSGTFTDQLPLNNSFSNYRLKANGVHAGIEDVNGEVYFPKIENDTILNASRITESGETINKSSVVAVKSFPGISVDTCGIVDSEGNKWYNWENKETTRHINDSGILYPNFLYLAKITVKYCYKNALGKYDISDTSNFKSFYRWYWTNTMYNENYYSIEDFNNLPFELSLDLSAQYNTEEYKSEVINHEVDIQDLITPENNFGTTQETITTKIKSKIDLGLLDTFNTFSLNPSIQADIYAYIGNKGIDANNANIVSVEGKYTFDSPVLHSERIPIGEAEPIFKDNYEELYNWQLLSTSEPLQEETKEFEYIDYKGEIVTLNSPKYISLQRVGNQYNTTFNYKAILFSNYYKYIEKKQETLPCLRPLVYDKDTASKYGITCQEDPKGEEATNLKLGGMISMGYFAEKSKEASGIGKEQFYLTESSYNPKEDNIHNSETYVDNPRSDDSSIGENLNLEDLSGVKSNADNPEDRYVEFRKPGFQLLRFFSFVNKGTGVFLGNPYISTNFQMYDQGKTDKIRYWCKYYNDFVGIGPLSSDSSYIGYDYLYNGQDITVFPSNTRPPVFLCYVFNKTSMIVLNSNINLTTNYQIPIANGIPSDLEVKKCLEEGAVPVLDFLTSLYVKDSAENISYNSIEDIVYLEPHKVIYNYSILYKSKLSKKQNNDTINISGIQFSKYLASFLLTNFPSDEINYSNVTIRFKDVLKTIPIQFELISKKPKITNFKNSANAVILKLTDSNSDYEKVNIEQLVDNQLYFINSANKIVPYLGGFFYYEHADSYKIDNTTKMIRKYQSKKESSSGRYSLYDGWEYNQETRQLIPNRKPNDKTVFTFNSWTTTWWTEQHKKHKWSAWELTNFSGLYRNIQVPTQFNSYI